LFASGVILAAVGGTLGVMAGDYETAGKLIVNCMGIAVSIRGLIYGIGKHSSLYPGHADSEL